MAQAGMVVMECSSGAASVSGRIGSIPARYPSRLPLQQQRRSDHNLLSKCWPWKQDVAECRWLFRPAAVVSTFPNTWVASDEATTIAAAEEAMALARAALLAAKQACQMSEADIQGAFNVSLEAETDKRGRLSSAVKQLEAIVKKDIAMTGPEGVETADDDVTSASAAAPAVAVAVRSKRRTQRMMHREKMIEKKKKPDEANKNVFANKYKSGKQVDGYFPQIVRRGRMTPAEELHSIKGIQELWKMDKIKHTLREQLGRDPTFREWANGLAITPNELKDRLVDVRRCKEMMVSSNMGLVIKVARKFSMKGTSTEDLIQEGIDGLLRGVEKFDTSRGFRLSTYVLWWIELSVRRAAVKRSMLCQVPMHLFDLHTRVMKTRALVFEERGEFPNDAEVAKLIGTSQAKVSLAANLMRRPKSLDDFVPGCDNVTHLEILPDLHVESAYTVAEKDLLSKQLQKVLDALDWREKEILRLRHGLADGKIRTLEELGHTFHLSRERIRQIEKKAFMKIEEMGGKKMLASFIRVVL